MPEISSSQPDFTDASIYPTDGLVLCVNGRTGVGKSSALSHLLNEGEQMEDALKSLIVAQLCPYPTITTRDKRPGEIDTLHDHAFVSDEAFMEMAECGQFLLTYETNRGSYGLPKLRRTYYARQAEWPITDMQVPIIMADNRMASALQALYPRTQVIEFQNDQNHAWLEARGDTHAATVARTAEDDIDETVRADVPHWFIQTGVYALEAPDSPYGVALAADYLASTVMTILSQKEKHPVQQGILL